MRVALQIALVVLAACGGRMGFAGDAIVDCTPGDPDSAESIDPEADPDAALEADTPVEDSGPGDPDVYEDADPEEEPGCTDHESSWDECRNGIDDDCDGDRDCDDCECINVWSYCGSTDPPETIGCDDGVDDDCDTLVDCEDPDCLVSSFCGGPPCPKVSLGSDLPVSFSGWTISNDETGSCGNGGADTSHEWTAPFDGTYTIDTLGSDFNTVLYVRDGGCDGPELGCNDNAPGTGFSRVTVDLAAGQAVVIVVEGACMWVGGDYVLNISSVPDP